MEVMLHGLPEHLTAESLEDQLEACMTRLGISRTDYGCQKAVRRPFAHVVFYSAQNGDRFLAKHGEVSQFIPAAKATPRNSAAAAAAAGRGDKASNTTRRRGPSMRPQLRLQGRSVWCKKSNRTPDPIIIRGMQEAKRQQENARKALAANPKDQPSRDKDVEFGLLGMGCGHCEFLDSELVFYPEQRWAWYGTVKFTKLNLFIINHDGTTRIRIPLSTIYEIIWFNYDRGDGYLTLTLDSVPWFLRTESSLEHEFARLMDDKRKPRQKPDIRMASIDAEHAEIVGTCLVYRLHVRTPKFMANIRDLERRGFTSILRYPLKAASAPHPVLGDFKLQASRLKQELIDATSAPMNSGKHLPFPHLFVVQSLFYNGYLHPGTVRSLLAQLFRRYLQDRLSNRPLISAAAIKSLMDVDCIPFPSPYMDPSYFEVSGLMRWITEKQQELQDSERFRTAHVRENSNLTQVYRAVVTPTRITLHGPELENKNRVLRKHPKNQDYFVRVQFCDENTQDLRFSPKISYDAVYDRFIDVLSRGIQIAGRTYSFLGFSHSSLRSHSVWFSAPFVDERGSLHTHLSIVRGLGDFEHIRCPAKCAARIGQAFSETPSVVDLNSHDVDVRTRCADLTNADGSRVFSDGIGVISEDMMRIIWDNIPNKNTFPTCFQIRWGGAKGMLALDSRLPGTQILFRDSMTKFESRDVHQLEICDTGSRPIPMVLNRQTIKILEDMGTEPSWFLEQQSRRIRELQSITASAYNTANFLHAQDVGKSMRLGSFLDYAYNKGMDYRQDSFLRGVVEAVVLRELRLLKHKARIPVRLGKTLFGVIDETGFLEEGEVFVTYEVGKDPGDERTPPPRNGLGVIITRSPALHPGDIQLANQVVPPQTHPLSRHRNCVVFSQKGQRDLPSQLSGGDLDGDIYNIIWDEGAMPSQTFEPADYPRTSALDIGRPVDSGDMAQFFIDFMKTDHLGVIATRHVIMADQLDEGTVSPECKLLAELHSSAVDFSKTGIPVELSELPKTNNKYRPDFLSPGPIAVCYDKDDILLEQYIVPEQKAEEEQGEAPHFKYYPSDKILGKLYRQIDEEKIWAKHIRQDIKPDARSFWDRFVEWAIAAAAAVGAVSWPVRVDSARRLKNAFDDDVKGYMTKYSDHPVYPISEREVFIGSILNKTGVQTHRQRDSSQKLHDDFERTAAHFARQMRASDDDESPAVPLTGYMAELGASAALDLCLACVCVGSEHDVPLVRARLGISHQGSVGSRHGGYGRASRPVTEPPEVQSFRVVAAAQFVRELRSREMERDR